MELILFGVVMLVLIGLIVYGVTRPGSPSTIWDKDRQRGWETQAQIEEREVGEMIGAQNERRGERGATPLTRREINARVARDQRRSIDRAERQERTT